MLEFHQKRKSPAVDRLRLGIVQPRSEPESRFATARERYVESFSSTPPVFDAFPLDRLRSCAAREPGLPSTRLGKVILFGRPTGEASSSARIEKDTTTSTGKRLMAQVLKNCSTRRALTRFLWSSDGKFLLYAFRLATNRVLCIFGQKAATGAPVSAPSGRLRGIVTPSSKRRFRMMKIFGVFLLVGACFGPIYGQATKPGASGTAEAVKQLERDWSEAMKARDIDKLSQILADDWSGLGYDGAKATKKEYLNDLKS